MVNRERKFGRLHFLIAVMIAVGLLLSTKLFFIQIIKGEKYRQTAERQNQQSLNKIFDRGAIFFETKDGTLVSGATLEVGYILAINPKQLVNPEAVYLKLNKIWPINQEFFIAKSKQRDDPYVEIAARLPAATGLAIRKLGLSGVQVIEQHFRSYPGGTLAAHALGFMGYNNDDYGGRYGLEKQYDQVLRRERTLSFTTFLSEILLGVSTSLGVGASSANLGDIVTTIEPDAQRFLENELDTVTTRWQTKAVGGIILDPKTGAIVAMAARPTFDPGKKQASLSLLGNPLVENVYEMGSIVKPLTLAAGLDAGVINEKTTYLDVGSMVIDGRIIRNYDGRARGQIALQEVLNQSLNMGAVFVMQKLGHERLREYFLNFGLGQKTGVDLPGEATGLTNNLNSTRAVEYATAAFGQGIAMTPLNITMALSSLANGGQLVRPYVVKEQRYETGLSDETIPEIRQRVVKEETAQKITAMLVRVVDEAIDGGRKR
ncbi:MAG: penicillin-binding protein 2, partial [Patescibacteria group bacterium]